MHLYDRKAFSDNLKSMIQKVFLRGYAEPQDCLTYILFQLRFLYLCILMLMPHNSTTLEKFLKSAPLGQNFALSQANMLVNNGLCVGQPPLIISFHMLKYGNKNGRSSSLKQLFSICKQHFTISACVSHITIVCQCS